MLVNINITNVTSVTRFKLKSLVKFLKSLILNRFNEPIFIVEESISPSIIGVENLMKFLKKFVFFILFINIAINNIIINDGKITPIVAIIAPSIPLLE